MLSSVGIYFGDFDSIDSVMYNFSLSPQDLEKVTILVASYDCQCYEGYAFVLFEKAGKLYEVHGSHCSCYGLEGQWEPEEVSIVELKKRATESSFDSQEVRETVVEILSYIELAGINAAIVALQLTK